MNILDKIATYKRSEVALRKEEIPLEVLRLLPHYSREGLSLKDRLMHSDTGIIAEFKRRSPSLPEINLEASVHQVAPAYMQAGAAGLSILTDAPSFGGSLEDLSSAREAVNIPLLRKDFIIDPYQIYEAKAIGADVILLIAALLTRKEIAHFSEIAKGLGLETLLEVHDEEELERSLMPGLDMIGVNNRNLKTFQVDLETSVQLAAKIPAEFVKVSESGIERTASIKMLQEKGFQGFLIGGSFMASPEPGERAAAFITELKQQ